MGGYIDTERQIVLREISRLRRGISAEAAQAIADYIVSNFARKTDEYGHSKREQ